MMDLITILALFIVFLSLLISHKNWKISRYVIFLSLYLLISAFTLIFYNILINGGFQSVFIVMVSTLRPVLFLAGPFFYFFIRGLLDVNYHFKGKDFLHFIPFYLSLFTLIPYLTEPLNDKFIYAQQSMGDLSFFMRSSLVSIPNWLVIQACIMHSTIYKLMALWTIYKANKKQKVANLNYGKQHKRNYIWFLLITCIALGMNVFHFCMTFLFSKIFHILNLNDFFTSQIFVYSTFFFVILQPIIYLLNPGIVYAYPASSKLNPLVREMKFKLDDHRVYAVLNSLDETLVYNNYFAKLSQKILAYIEEYKPYLAHDFSVKKFSRLISVPSQHIHFCVKYNYGSTCLNMMQSLRIKHFIDEWSRSEDKSEIDIQALVYSSGFSSYKVFLKQFKLTQGVSFDDWYAANT